MTSYELAQMEYDSAFNDGWDAFLCGNEQRDCPYKAYALRNEWFKGWAMAKEVFGEPTYA